MKAGFVANRAFTGCSLGQNPAFIGRKENSYARVTEHNRKLLKENVELKEESKKLQKIRTAIGEDRAAEILRAGKSELIR